MLADKPDSAREVDIMHVIVAGAGAVGSHYASLMQLGGMHVSLLARGAHFQAMRESGLRHVSMGEEQIVAVDAYDNPSCLQQADIVLFSCKMTGLASLLHEAKPHIQEHALLISLQNGVQAPALLANVFPDQAIAAGIAFIGARLQAPGHVIHSAAGRLSFGPWRTGPGGPMLSEFVQALSHCGIGVRLVDDIRQSLWRKMLWNCGFNAITALTCRFAADIAEHDDYCGLAVTAMDEVLPVAEAHDVKMTKKDVEQAVKDTLNCGPVKTSMWQDLEQNRPTEIDHLNGFIASEALRIGLDTPVNAMLATLMHARQKNGN
ncbi:MAG: 2-dehydropantoate 2-reductase [Mariprofundaceae bacterium]